MYCQLHGIQIVRGLDEKHAKDIADYVEEKEKTILDEKIESCTGATKIRRR